MLLFAMLVRPSIKRGSALDSYGIMNDRILKCTSMIILLLNPVGALAAPNEDPRDGYHTVSLHISIYGDNHGM